jgi:hypothetical protein
MGASCVATETADVTFVRATSIVVDAIIPRDAEICQTVSRSPTTLGIPLAAAGTVAGRGGTRCAVVGADGATRFARHGYWSKGER